MRLCPSSVITSFSDKKSHSSSRFTCHSDDRLALSRRESLDIPSRQKKCQITRDLPLKEWWLCGRNAKTDPRFRSLWRSPKYQNQLENQWRDVDETVAFQWEGSAIGWNRHGRQETVVWTACKRLMYAFNLDRCSASKSPKTWRAMENG
jgi:hypothetical protein